MSAPRPPALDPGTAHGTAHERSETTAFGFWTFLMSDLIVFGILFATYIVMSDARAGGPGPRALFDLNSIAAQTALLLSSSFTYGLASLSVKHGRRVGPVAAWLVITAVLGGGFVMLEIRDFMHMADAGGVPARSGWLSALWALVGLHGLHVAAGLLWIGVMLALLAARGLSETTRSRLTLLGLYWHFLDLVWIGIFSIVFLGGLA